MDESADIDEAVFKHAVDEYLLRIDIFDSVWAKWTHPSFREKALNVLRKERAILQIDSEDVVL